MSKTQLPTNYVKHTSKNPLQKLLIERFFSSLVALAKPLGAKKVLDAGCGEGFSLNKLIINKVGVELEGIEYSKDAIDLGKKLFPKANIKQGSIYELPYKNGSFDLVVCTEVLEHMDEPTKALKEIVRVSKKNLIISVPNEPFFMLGNFIRGKNLSRLGNDPGHINHWNIISIRKFLLNENVKIIKTKFPFPWIMLLLVKN
jgi:2-polyprenyl-3-methyl-5-hydroxy-6-metoxy-1,4-benzoquinol methylase